LLNFVTYIFQEIVLRCWHDQLVTITCPHSYWTTCRSDRKWRSICTSYTATSGN